MGYHPDRQFPAPQNRILGVGKSPYYFWPSNPAAALGKWIIESSSGSFYGSATDAAADWYYVATNSGTVTMGANGLILTTGATDGNNTTVQRCEGATVAASKHFIAVWRQKHDVVATGKSANGFYLTGLDPIGTIPVSGAWFEKTTGTTGAITCITSAASTATTSTGHTAVLDTFYDYGIVINGTTNTQFWQKATTTEAWTLLATHTTNLPAGAMRLSFNRNASNSGGVDLSTIRYWNLAMEI